MFTGWRKEDGANRGKEKKVTGRRKVRGRRKESHGIEKRGERG